MKETIANFLFLIAVLDPLGSVPVYLEATKEFLEEQKKSIAIRSSIIAFIILLFFIVLGQLIMDGMQISLDAFQISGGIILFLFALTMIFGEGKPTREKDQITDYEHVIVFPIAIPSIASPGAIMAVVLMTDNHIYTLQEQAITTLLVMVVVALTCGLLLVAKSVQSKIGDYGITIISKVMGLLLAAYATQNILMGLKAFFTP
ncbi:MAG: MarC family protein [Aureispira sp.]